MKKKKRSPTPVVLPLSMRFLEKAAEIPEALESGGVDVGYF